MDSQPHEKKKCNWTFKFHCNIINQSGLARLKTRKHVTNAE